MSPDEIIEVVQAYKDGRKIQFRQRGTYTWKNDFGVPAWDFFTYDYRIKPEEKKPREWSIALGMNDEVLGVGPVYAGAIVEIKKPIQQVSDVIRVREVLD